MEGGPPVHLRRAVRARADERGGGARRQEDRDRRLGPRGRGARRDGPRRAAPRRFRRTHEGPAKSSKRAKGLNSGDFHKASASATTTASGSSAATSTSSSRSFPEDYRSADGQRSLPVFVKRLPRSRRLPSPARTTRAPTSSNRSSSSCTDAELVQRLQRADESGRPGRALRGAGEEEGPGAEETMNSTRTTSAPSSAACRRRRLRHGRGPGSA